MLSSLSLSVCVCVCVCVCLRQGEKQEGRALRLDTAQTLGVKAEEVGFVTGVIVCAKSLAACALRLAIALFVCIMFAPRSFAVSNARGPRPRTWKFLAWKSSFLYVGGREGLKFRVGDAALWC